MGKNCDDVRESGNKVCGDHHVTTKGLAHLGDHAPNVEGGHGTISPEEIVRKYGGGETKH